MKVQFTVDGGGSFISDIPTTFKVSPHFTLGEVANNKAKDEVKMIMNPSVQMFFRGAEDLRAALVDAKALNLKKGLVCSSYYRTPAYNKLVGGSSNSDHLLGLAMDITKQSFNAWDDATRNLVTAIWKMVCEKYGVNGYINWYTNGFHIGFSNLYKQFTIVDYRGKSGDW